MRAEAGLTSAQLQVIRAAEALVWHELGYLGWVSLCDTRYEHGELTANGAAGFPINGMWRPAVPGPNASEGQRRAWLEATPTKRYAWRYLMAAGMVWRSVCIARIRAMEGPMALRSARQTGSPVTGFFFDRPTECPRSSTGNQSGASPD